MNDEPIDLRKGEQHRKLGDLNRKLRDSWECTRQLTERANEITQQAEAERILAGEYLNEIKAIVGRNNLVAWLMDHRPEIKPEPARRAMKRLRPEPSPEELKRDVLGSREHLMPSSDVPICSQATPGKGSLGGGAL